MKTEEDLKFEEAVQQEHNKTKARLLRWTKQNVAHFLSAMMEKDEWRQSYERVLAELRVAGQKEYAHDDDSPFRNFEALSGKLDIDRLKVAMVYTMKHLDGVTAYINGHRSQRESVHGRFRDLHLYLFLIEGMIHESEGTTWSD